MEDKIRELQSIMPKMSAAQAAQYLEAAKGDVEAAINLAVEDGDDMDEDESPRPPSPPKPSSSSSAFGGAGSASTPGAQKKKKKDKPKPGGGERRVASLVDLQSDSDHDHSDEEEGQEFFAGGKASAVALQGPPTAKSNTRETIENILKTAQENGRKERERDTEPTPPAAGAKKSRVFHGSGNRLGDGSEPEPEPEPTPQPGGSQQQPPLSQGSIHSGHAHGQAEDTEMEELTYTLTFWEDGFSVDDGPLRDYKDPASVRFLRILGEGKVPEELQAKTDQPVRVLVQHKVQEKYVPPKKVLKPFSGSGHRLGSEVPGETTGFTTTSAPVQAQPPAAVAPSAPAQSAPAPATLGNEGEPLTTVQIRLADGTRLVAKFNPTQTVGDIVRFINMARSGESQRNYVLMTTFPNKELTDPTATLQSASLLNAVVVQRYK